LNDDIIIDPNLKKCLRLFIEDKSKEILKIYEFDYEPDVKNKLNKFCEKEGIQIDLRLETDNRNYEYLSLKKKDFPKIYKESRKEKREMILHIKDSVVKTQIEENVI
jgi:hypothetical protein